MLSKEEFDSFILDTDKSYRETCFQLAYTQKEHRLDSHIEYIYSYNPSGKHSDITSSLIIPATGKFVRITLKTVYPVDSSYEAMVKSFYEIEERSRDAINIISASIKRLNSFPTYFIGGK